MLLIAHRGNTEGREPNFENNPDYVDKAIKQGFSVEIDLRTVGKKVFLGHDAPQYQISEQWLRDRSNWLWVHCKDQVAMMRGMEFNLNYFWHENDAYTMTSKGYVWAYPGKNPCTELTIMVMPEQYDLLGRIHSGNISPKPFGVCSDYVNFLRHGDCDVAKLPKG